METLLVGAADVKQGGAGQPRSGRPAARPRGGWLARRPRAWRRADKAGDGWCSWLAGQARTLQRRTGEGAEGGAASLRGR